MEISDDILKRVADLSNLQFEEEGDKQEIKKEFSKIIDYVEKINELDVEGVTPLSRPIKENTRLREDTARDKMSQAEALREAPKKAEGFFAVPKVLEQ